MKPFLLNSTLLHLLKIAWLGTHRAALQIQSPLLFY